MSGKIYDEILIKKVIIILIAKKKHTRKINCEGELKQQQQMKKKTNMLTIVF